MPTRTAAVAFLFPLVLASLTAVALPRLPGVGGGDDAGGQVEAELLADVAAVRPGEPFTVGVLLKLSPGWHVYWLNPGAAGTPTRVTFTLPEGFTAGELQFPVPIRFDQPGDSLGYGYEGEVLLTATITPPADLPADGDVRIAADVRWLTCSAEVCIPGGVKLNLALPVSAGDGEAERTHAEVFEAWAAKQPVEQESAPAIKEAAWSTDEESGSPVLEVTWAGEVTDVDFFPGRDAALDVKGVTVQTEGDKTRVAVDARLWPNESPAADELASLLVFTDADGKRWGVKTQMPVAPLAAGRAPEEK